MIILSTLFIAFALVGLISLIVGGIIESIRG